MVNFFVFLHPVCLLLSSIAVLWHVIGLLQRTLQGKAARFVTSDYQSYELGSVTTLLKDLGWMSLRIKRKVDRLCLLKTGLDNNTILPLDELSKPGRTTRHTHNRYYTTIHARTNIFKFSFVPRTIRDWNNLPHNVVEIEDDAKFRKSLLFTNL